MREGILRAGGVQGIKLLLTKDGERADLRGAFVVEASPGPGAAGAIALTYLVESLNPLKLGEVRSPYFPHISLVDEGVAMPPRMELYLYEGAGSKLVIILRNFPVDSSEGSYLIARELYRFLRERGATSYCLLSSSRITGEAGVYVVSSNPEDARIFLNSGARLSPSLEMLPADKLSSYMLMLYSREGGSACVLISEVLSYFPDPMAAKRLLEVLSKALGFEVNLDKLDKEIEKQKRVLEELQRGYGQLFPPREQKPTKEPFYIG